MTNQDARQVPIAEAMRLAIDHHQAGRIGDAESIYRAVLDAEPAHAAANNNLGLIALQAGRMREAVSALKLAREAEPRNGSYWMNYAVALAGSGDAAAARDVLLQARQLGLGGSTIDATLDRVEQMMRGQGAVSRAAAVDTSIDGERTILDELNRLFRNGRHAEMEQLASEALTRFPRSLGILNLLAASRLARGECEGALDVLARARVLAPEDTGILNLIGVAWHRLGNHEEAARALDQSLTLDPLQYEALVNASTSATGAGDPAAAVRFAERALAVRPEGVEALFALGNAAAAAGDDGAAAAAYRRAIALVGSNVDLFLNLGNVLIRGGNAAEGALVLQRALDLQPNNAAVHLNLARALHDLGETVAARAHFRTASDLAPALGEAHSAYLFSLAHDETIAPEAAFAEHLRIGDIIEGPVKASWRGHDNDPDPERELRLGFVSGDLREHPVAYLIEPIWRGLQGRRVRIFAYSNIRATDAVNQRLRALAHEWVQIERLSDEALCERIRADHIDVLFDLSGHTALNRLPVFARRPAPIQVSWIGYPGTTGLSAMDYRFVRGLGSNLKDADALFREKLVRFRLRGLQPETSAPAVRPPPGLAAGHVTFGSFNRVSKIGESVIALWSRVLRELPTARLLLAAVPEARAQERLQAAFAAHGIGLERLDFRPRVPMQEYLSLHHEVDIALDTFPYTGGTTTSHALWMGVPVLTLVGRGLQQNQGAMILGALGMSDWMVQTEDAYVAKACAAATDWNALATLRRDLRERMTRTHLGSEDDIGDEVELALRTVWKRWCAGQPPVSIAL